MVDRKIKPYYKECEGVIVPGVFSSEAVRSALDYQHRPGDLFIVTYPKCGTTWIQHIVMLILRNGKPLTGTLEFMTASPSLEMCGAESVYNMTNPGGIKTHLPFHKMKLCPQSKYIYVARNPKDCLISFYHHTKNFPLFNFEDGTFDEFFELFMEGKVEHGDYFEHLISGYGRRNEPNVYFVTYEKLKENTRDEILKIAKFIDDKYEEQLKKQPKILDDVLYYSSLDYMKSKTNKNFSSFMKDLLDKSKAGDKIPFGLKEFANNIKQMNVARNKNIQFVRKGRVGDWKNYLTKEEEIKLEELIKRKTANSDVMSLWDGI